MNYFYLSFATKTQFIGAVLTRAANADHAFSRVKSLGLNPGGECLIAESDYLPESAIPYIDRLLTKEELEKALGPVVRLADMDEDERKLLDENVELVCGDCNKPN